MNQAFQAGCRGHRSQVQQAKRLAPWGLSSGAKCVVEYVAVSYYNILHVALIYFQPRITQCDV